MKIHELKIEGFKSIGEIKLVEPNPFSVFVGPNAAGKSNIFEALEFMELCNIMMYLEVFKLFGGATNLINSNNKGGFSDIAFHVNLGKFKPNLTIYVKTYNKAPLLGESSFADWVEYSHSSGDIPHYMQAFKHDLDYISFTNFTRLLVNESKEKVKRNLQDDTRLSSDASNLEKVLKRILKDEKDREEIVEMLQLLIPGFSNLEIRTEELSGSDNLVIYEDALKKPLTKRLISDGTYNIIALITAIYQSEEPQFLCIEEPENGLNPKVVRQLVSLFRDKCKEKGHYIWLNTHSQTLVSELTPDEIILVDKVNGNTQTKQVKGFDLHGMKMDEALLTNALGGGIPW
ncbi:MAG: AAA family ATPase [Chitinophagales bacterium]